MSLQQVLYAVRNKYGHLGLAESVLVKLAEQIMKSTKAETTNEELDTVVAEYLPLAQSFQSETDRRVTEATAKAKLPQEQTKTVVQGSEAQPAEKDAPPAWFSTFASEIKSEIAGIKGTQTLGSREKQLNDVLAGANEIFKSSTLKSFLRMNFKDEQDYLAYLEEVKADVAANPSQAQEKVEKPGGGNSFVPGGGTGGGGGKADVKAIDATIAAWAKE